MTRKNFLSALKQRRNYISSGSDIGQRACGAFAFRGTTEMTAVDRGHWGMLRSGYLNAQKNQRYGVSDAVAAEVVFPICGYDIQECKSDTPDVSSTGWASLSLDLSSGKSGQITIESSGPSLVGATVFNGVMKTPHIDAVELEDAFEAPAAMDGKLFGVVLGGVENLNGASRILTQYTLAKLANMSKTKAEPVDYAKAVTEFASAYSTSNADHMAAFAQVAKKAQMETVELMLAAGKDVSEDATAAVKNATTKATIVTMKENRR